MCLIDLDHFKQINDAYGHPAGDQVLQALVDALQPTLRSTDVFARYGGEEFALLLTRTSGEEALAVAERIRSRIEEMPLPTVSPELRVSVSIGVAQYQSGWDIADLLIHADRALYRAKSAGRNTVSVASLQDGETRAKSLDHPARKQELRVVTS